MISGTGGTRSSEEVYEAYQPSLDQFGKDSLTYIPSSPFTKVGKFHDLYVTGNILLDEYLAKVGELKEKSEEEKLIDIEEGLENFSDPEMLIVQLPSWGLYKDWEKSPKLGGPRFKRAIQYSTDGEAPENLRMRRLERRNPEKFKVERRGQFASVVDAYLNPQKVEDMFKPLWDGRVLSEQTHGKMMMTYSGHADPGRSNANFAMAIAHLEDAPPDEHGEVWPHVVFDYLKVWRPQDYEDKVVDYVEIQHHISEMFNNYPGLTHFSFDQWNSAGFIANLRQEFTPRVRVQEVTFTRSSNIERAEKFKSALNLGWVHTYRDDFYDGSGSLLENELLFLQEKNGDIVKQEFGPVQTKDLADCHDSETEVLTEGGWKLFKDVSMGERVATVNSKGVVEYQYPTDRVDRYYEGEMLRAEFTKRGRSVNFMVTPGHRMLSRSYHDLSTNWDYHFETAEETFKKHVKIPIAPSRFEYEGRAVVDLTEVLLDPLPTPTPREGECQCGCGARVSDRYLKGHVNLEPWTSEQEQFLVENYSHLSMKSLMHVCNKSTRNRIYQKAGDLRLTRGQIGDRVNDRPTPLPETSEYDFARFVGFWLGDGHKSKANHGYGVQISVVRERKKLYLEGLFASLGWDYTRRVVDPEVGEESFTVYSYELREYLKGLVGEGHELHLPKESLTQWESKSREGLVEGLLASDGHGDNSFSSSSKTLVEGLQEVLVAIGHGSRVRETSRPGVAYAIGDKVGVSQKSIYELHIFRKNYVGVEAEEVERVQYKGTVHCLTVPNSTLITRRGGQTLVSGNCVMETTASLLGDALDRWSRKLSQMPTSFGSTDVPGLRSGREQVRNPGMTESKYSRQMSDLMNERRRGRRDLGGGNRLRGRF